MPAIDEFLTQVLQGNGSDLHFLAGDPPRIRQYGELKERKHRTEDAVRNAKAAIEEGLLPGGGVALANAASTAFDTLRLDGDEATGANIVRTALTAPLRQIAVNSGLEGGVVVDKVANLPAGHGLNAATGQYV